MPRQQPPRRITIATLTYAPPTAKLHTRAIKIAYNLLHKVGTSRHQSLVKPGDRVALVYPNNEPIAFTAAFFGCLLAGVVPVPIEVPLTKRVSGRKHQPNDVSKSDSDEIYEEFSFNAFHRKIRIIYYFISKIWFKKMYNLKLAFFTSKTLCPYSNNKSYMNCYSTTNKECNYISK